MLFIPEIVQSVQALVIDGAGLALWCGSVYYEVNDWPDFGAS